MEQETPRDIQVEKAALGCCLISRRALVKAIRLLSPDCFYDITNRRVFGSMVKLFKENKEVDLVTIKSEASDCRDVAIVEFTEMTSLVPNTDNIDSYIELLLEKRDQRKAIQLGSELMDLGYRGAENIADKIKEKAISFSNGSNEDVDMETAIASIDEKVGQFKDQMASGKYIMGSSTGIPKLDEVLNGIQPGLFYVIAGYTSSGKSQLTLNIVNSLLKEGQRVLLLSLEMSPRQVATRMISIDSGERIDHVEVMYNRYTKENLSDNQIKNITQSRDRLRRAKISISMDSNWTRIKARLAEIAIMKNFDVVVIDFIQNVQAKEEEYTKLTNAAVEIQSFCVQNGVTVIATSQIPKDAQINKYDDVISLKGSGALAEKADCVMLITYDTKNFSKDDFDAMKSRGEPLPTLLNIQKNRGGRTGGISLGFHTNTGRFLPDLSFDDL